MFSNCIVQYHAQKAQFKCPHSNYTDTQSPLIFSLAALFDQVSDSEDIDVGDASSLEAAPKEEKPGGEEGDEEGKEGEEDEDKEEGEEGEGAEAEGEGEGEQGPEGDDVSRVEGEDAVSRGGGGGAAVGGKPKKLTNQFNFCERAALTYNNPTRVYHNTNSIY